MKWNDKGVAVIGIILSMSAYAGVYDDVAYWLKPNDRSSSGYVRSSTSGAYTGDYGCDFVNVKTAAAGADCVTNRFGVYGPANGLGIVEETVCMPMSGEELSGVPCLRFSKNEWIDKDVTPWTTNSYPNVMRSKDEVFANGIFKDTVDYAIVMRLRRDPSSPITLENGYETRILGFFFKSGSGGVRLCLKAGSEDDARELRVMYANGKYSDPVCQLPTDKWADVAIVSSNGGKTLDVYARVEGDPLTNDVNHVTATLTGDYTLAPVKGQYFVLGSGDALGGVRKFGITSGYANAWVTYYGSVQHLAVWNRSLTINEVREAFSGTQPDLWHVGIADGSAAEFAGESDLQEFAVESAAWHLMPQGLDAERPSYSFVFNGRESLVGYPQIFLFKATGSSVAGRVALTVNGSLIEERDVVPSGEAVFFIPENVIRSGENTLCLARLDSGEGTLEWDRLALGGSWMLGSEDASCADFDDKDGRQDPYQVQTGLPGVIYPLLSDYTEGTRTRSIIFELGEAVLRRGIGFSYDTRLVQTSKYFLEYGKSVTVRLNGNVLGNVTPETAQMPYSVMLPHNLLVAGANTITLSVPEMEDDESGHYWTGLDFHRIRVLPPPVGLVVTFR